MGGRIPIGKDLLLPGKGTVGVSWEGCLKGAILASEAKKKWMIKLTFLQCFKISFHSFDDIRYMPFWKKETDFTENCF